MKRQSNTASSKELSSLLKPCYKAGMILAVLSAVQSILWVLLAWATRGVINAVGNSERSFQLWCAVLLTLAVAVPLLRTGIGAYSGHATDRDVARLRQNIWGLLQYKDCEEVNTYHSGQLFSRMIGDSRTLCEKYTRILPGIVSQVVQLFAAVTALLILRPSLVGLLLICGCCTAAVGIVLRKVLKTRHLAVRQTEEQLTSFLQEHLEHLETGRSIAADGVILNRFESKQTNWIEKRKYLRKVSSCGSAVFSTVVQVGSAVVIVWGALAIHRGSLQFGDLTAILQLLNLFRSPVSGLTGIQSQLAAADAAQERLIQLWNIPAEPAGQEISAGAVCSAVVFDHVTFSYDGEEEPVFQDFSARIDMGRWTCLTGASGRGKSTLYRLILGLFQPESGKIYLETERGMVECSAATRKMFSFVPQTPILFSGSIRENLLLARPDAREADLWQALKRAECDFVKELPDGLNTLLGEGGEGLSVGQCQRIAIARALLSKANMLLLDEITSALDHETEMRLLRNLAKECPSVLIATHKPGMLANIDADSLNLEAEKI